MGHCGVLELQHEIFSGSFIILCYTANEFELIVFIKIYGYLY